MKKPKGSHPHLSHLSLPFPSLPFPSLPFPLPYPFPSSQPSSSKLRRCSERALESGDKRGREREGRDAALKKRLTLKVKRLDRRAGLERVGQGDGPLVADSVPWKKYREGEGKEKWRRG